MTKTPVIFRKYKDGEVVAIFPTIPGTQSYDCMCYHHIGQHGVTDQTIINVTKPCTPDEYKDLLEELVSIGYDDLIVRKKFTYNFMLERQKQMRERIG